MRRVSAILTVVFAARVLGGSRGVLLGSECNGVAVRVCDSDGSFFAAWVLGGSRRVPLGSEGNVFAARVCNSNASFCGAGFARVSVSPFGV